MNNKGFTLVELLVSIALIAIISLIITPTVVNVIKENKIESCKKIFTSTEEAARNYVSDNRYSTITNMTASDLIAKGYLTGNTTNPLNKTDVKDDIIVTIVFDGTTKKYKYETKINEKTKEEYCQ